MFEITMKGQTYQFHFGMGFLREINRKASTPVDGIPDARKNVGLRYKLAGLFDGDLEDLCRSCSLPIRASSPG